jgi:hypothetical protein
MMQLPLATCVLLAAGFDWLEALLPFLFVTFWIVSQVFAVFRRLQGGGRKPPPLPRFDPARDRPRPPQPAAEDAADPRSDLEKQIAEFLRDVTGEKKPQPTIKKIEPRKIEAKKSEPVVAVRPQPPRGATPVRREQQQKREQKKVIATQEAAAARTAETAPQQRQPESESVARHVQDAFSHELTHLRGAIAQGEPQAGGAPRTAMPTQAEELLHLLRNPATVRLAIVLREVLDRPVDRW